jgi:hypothetical protein
MATLHLRFEPGQEVPTAGQNVIMGGMAGKYRVHISKVLESKQHPTDGATLLKVRGTKKLIEEK